MSSQRQLLLCADDYGISPGVNQGILSLAEQSRLSAVSCMAAAQYFEIAAEKIKPCHEQVSLGLHLTLTYLPSLSTGESMRTEVELLKETWLRRIDATALKKEMEMQFQRFIDVFGFAPDFVDGHQHIHVLPIVRDFFLSLREKYAPLSWVRNVVDLHGLEKKRAILAVLGWRFLQELKARGIPYNQRIFGFYDYTQPQDFADLFAHWIPKMPENAASLCYVHPGHPDEALAKVDTVTTPRQKEFLFFNSPAFADLCCNSISLVRSV